MSTANRKYKDSVFVDLFSEDEKAKENFLSLYNALHGTNLQLSCPVENIRLDNTLYMNIINDVSCLVDNKIIVLTEHPRSRMYILELQVCRANLFLRGTSGIRAASDTGKNSTNKGQKLITRRQFIRASTFENR